MLRFPFLKKFPPFYDLGATDLADLALEISIVYKEKESVVFNENEPPHSCFYVVNKGAIALKKNCVRASVVAFHRWRG